MTYRRLARDFFRQPTLEVARALIGKRFVVRRNGEKLSGRIVETEAYIGEDDPACHARFGRTERNAVMFGDAGVLYVYFIYGMYNMLNFVTEPKGCPAAVLIRALEPLDGIDVMMRNRSVQDRRRLTSGPGMLCRALAISTTDTGKSLFGREFAVIDEGIAPPIRQTSRIGISDGHDLLWRFYDAESKFVSRI
jgi:DNA-3-methyladenine glycosylase